MLKKTQFYRFFGHIIIENNLHLISIGKDLAKETDHFKFFTTRKITDDFKGMRATGILEELNYSERQKKVALMNGQKHHSVIPAGIYFRIR